MSNSRHTARSIVAVGAATVLTLAACGGDDEAPDTTAPSAEDTTAETSESTGDSTNDAASEEAADASSIAFEAQQTDGSGIVIASVDLPAPGFIAVHSDGGGSPGPVIGVSSLLPEGASESIEITLDEPVTADTTLFPMVHIDTNGNGVYEFGTVEGVDGPGTTADGEVAVVGAEVTVGDGGGTGDATTDESDESADENAAPADDDTSITIADFAFSGVTEVAAGTTVTVTNTDSAPHTWTAVDGAFASDSLGEGDTFEFTFDEPGTYEYFCNFHPSMTGTITVTG